MLGHLNESQKRRLPGRAALALPLLAAALASPAANAAEAPSNVLEQKSLSLALANELATAALQACRAKGQSGVVAVVDRGGNLVAVQRGDGVGPHNTAAAQRKAFTALSTKSKTGALAERARNDPASQNLSTVGELLLLGGGVPVMADGQVIGAVGMAGAGGSANDEGCAVQAIEATLPGGAGKQ